MSAQVEDRADATRDKNIVVRSSSEYQDWLFRLAVAARAPVAVIVDQALARFAASMNFEQPPRR